jgi:hypothetical protein
LTLPAALLLASTGAQAQKLDFSLSSESVRLGYAGLIGTTHFGRTELSAGLLFNDDDNMVLDVGLHSIDVVGSRTPGLEVGVGPRLYYVSLDRPDADTLALALGAHLRYKPAELQRVVFYGSLDYAPSITTAMDAGGLSEFSLRLAYELHASADAYVGYRRIRMDVEEGADQGNKTVDSGVFLGVRFGF